MKLHIASILALALSGCAHLATVKEVKPQLSGFKVQAGKNPLVTLDNYIGAAESAWNMLERDPADAAALREYNFAVARIVGSLRESKLTPWTAPLRLGSHTLAWKRDPRPERNPANYEFIPADQLAIKGKSMDVREVKAGLGAPLVAKRIADQAHEFAPTPHFFFCVTAVVISSSRSRMSR